MTPPTARSIAGFDACVASHRRRRPIGVALRDRRGPRAARRSRRARCARDDPPEPPVLGSTAGAARACWPSACRRARAAYSKSGAASGCRASSPPLRGARVVFADRVSAPLASVARVTRSRTASMPPGSSSATSSHAVARISFDLVLAGRGRLRPCDLRPARRRAAGVARPGGRDLLADGHRIDTARLLRRDHGAGSRGRVEDVRVEEEGFPVTITHRHDASRLELDGLRRRAAARPNVARLPVRATLGFARACRADGIASRDLDYRVRTSRSSGRAVADRCRAGGPPRSCCRSLLRERGARRAALPPRRASAATPSARSSGKRRRAGRATAGGSSATPIDVGGRERERALDRVLQLAHVARPVVRVDARERVGRDPLRRDRDSCSE